jgi:DNA-binding CsgD family transcriptional regulator
MYEETGNIIVTLQDRLGSCKFVVFRSVKGGKRIHIFDEDGNYAACFSRYHGFAIGERGLRRFFQCITMLKKSIETGVVTLTVEKSTVAPRAQIPLSKRERIILKMAKNGATLEEIKNYFSLSKKRMNKIKRQLEQKGVVLNEIITAG